MRMEEGGGGRERSSDAKNVRKKKKKKKKLWKMVKLCKLKMNAVDCSQREEDRKKQKGNDERKGNQLGREVGP